MTFRKRFFAALCLILLVALLEILPADAGSTYIQTADNFIVLFDTSGSMAETYRDSGKSKQEVTKEILRTMNRHLPNLGYQASLQSFTPYKVYLPMGHFDRERFAEAIEAIPPQKKLAAFFGPPTPLGTALNELGPILARLPGRTVVFLFTDGRNTDELNPLEEARFLDRRYDVCFQIISMAQRKEELVLLERIAALNDCSAILPFDDVATRPNVCFDVLCTLETTPDPVPETVKPGLDSDGDGVADNNDLCPDSRPGYAVDGNGCLMPVVQIFPDIGFKFDAADLSSEAEGVVDEVGRFLAAHPESNVLVSGNTCDMGPEDYNAGLSERRAKTVAEALKNRAGVAERRITTLWHGERRPLADNRTAFGRKENRRVEVIIGRAYRLKP